MARSGRRLVIGGSGNLSGDDTLSETGGRGEVRRYVPLSETEQAKQAAKIAQASAPAEPAAPPSPVIILPDTPSGGDGGAGPGPSAPDAPASPGEGGGPGPGAGGDNPSGDAPSGPDGPDFKRGGKVGPKGGDVEPGEFVLPVGAVKQYPPAFLEALRRGKASVMTHSQYIKSKTPSAPSKRRLV